MRPRLARSENWPLRGLYWLSKDFFEEDFKDVMDPDARALAEMRNHLEHKYVKVHWMTTVPHPSAHDIFHDTLAHAVSRNDLERRALRMLKLARAALIYLSLGMHREESMRAAAATTDPGKIAPSMPLPLIEDDTKRRW